MPLDDVNRGMDGLADGVGLRHVIDMTASLLPLG
jgi:Zn-dependent alcohol dehydrogenase